MWPAQCICESYFSPVATRSSVSPLTSALWARPIIVAAVRFFPMWFYLSTFTTFAGLSYIYSFFLRFYFSLVSFWFTLFFSYFSFFPLVSILKFSYTSTTFFKYNFNIFQIRVNIFKIRVNIFEYMVKIVYTFFECLINIFK